MTRLRFLDHAKTAIYGLVIMSLLAMMYLGLFWLALMAVM